jgi:basic membrane protein A
MENRRQTTKIYKFFLIPLSFILSALAFLFVMLISGASSRPAYASTTKVGLVTDSGTINDNSFNALSYQGLLHAQIDFGIVGTVYNSTSSDDYIPNLQQCAADGNALCFSVSFLTADAVYYVASQHPSVKFAILDFAFDSYPNNLRGISFYVNEPAYLAGILAGQMSDSKIVGEIGGMDIPEVRAFILPFRNGAKCASPSATALITYTNDFDNPTHGAQVAQTLISRDADAIFSAAGPTGSGAGLSAAQSGAWAVGVDTDWYSTVFDDGAVAGSDKVLTSVQKKLDTAVYLTIQDLISSAFTSGTVRYGLAADGVGLAPYHETDSVIPTTTKNQVELLKQYLVVGAIDPNSTICRKFIYLPVITK